MRVLLLFSCLLALSGCTSTTDQISQPPSDIADYSDTMEMRRMAAEQYPQSLDGTFTLKVSETGHQRDAVFLNTESDYRDPRNITISLSPDLAREFFSLHHQLPQHYYKGKTLQVSGELKQVEILFISDGKPSGKYYFQTHVRPRSLDDITVIDAG